MQKAQVVALVKKTGAITLGIVVKLCQVCMCTQPRTEGSSAVGGRMDALCQ